MAGFWHLSHHQMRDPNGRVLAGARGYFFRADTLAPITVYQDYSLGTPHPNPVEANGYGVFPPVFLDEDDGFYRQRITTSSGVIVPGTDVGTLPIIGPSSSGGGSEVPVDPNSLLQTGDPLWVPISGSRPGFVRMNGRTIGSSVSGASERANADCEALYLHNWNNFSDTFCPVIGGRGASAAADWQAGKQITLLSMQNKGPFGLAGMGNAATTEFDGVTFVRGDQNTPASIAGAAKVTITKEKLPALTLATVIPAGQGNHDHLLPLQATNGEFVGSGGTGAQYGTPSRATSPSTLPQMTGTTALDGGGEAVEKLPPLMLGTWYQRL